MVTYNRPVLLKECLLGLGRQHFSGSYEVIVIDNGSTQSPALPADPLIRYFRCHKRQSLESCKKLGVNLARGEIIAFTDDDCLPAPGWLENILTGVKDTGIAAGPVLAEEGARFPGWWKPELDWLVGINPHPDQDYPPLGSNIAFKKEILLGIPDTDNLKNPPYLYPYHEDNRRLKAAISRGFSWRFVPAMIVYHHIPPSRLRLGYLIKRSYREGASRVHYERSLHAVLRSFAGIPADLLRMILFRQPERLFRMIEKAGYLLNFALAQ